MRDVASFAEIYLHRLPVDGRKQINGLSLIVQESIGKSPFAGSLFAFVSKRRDQVRLLYWDKTGFAMWVKRLEKDKFRWPTKMDGDVIALSSKQLTWLLDGIDIAKIAPHETLIFSTVR